MLVRALFPYPEPSFTSSAGEPNNRPAIDADELESVHQTFDQGRCSSIPTLPRASPVSPASQNTTGKMPRRRRPVKDPVVISFFRSRVFLQVFQCISVNF